MSDPRLQHLGHWPPDRLSAVLAARMNQHRLCRLRATATLPAVELVDSLDVSAHLAFQNYTAAFAAFDVVHDSSPSFLRAAHSLNQPQFISAYRRFIVQCSLFNA